MIRGRPCTCDPLFTEFEWSDLKSLSHKDLPDRPGVYTLRIADHPNEASIKVKQARSLGADLLSKASWRQLWKHYWPRLARLEAIDPSTCPVIYIGGTGRGSGSIKTRFQDLAGWRHTIFFPVFVLLLAGCNIDYGWKTLNTATEAFNYEENLKQRCRAIHGRPPALNKA